MINARSSFEALTVKRLALLALLATLYFPLTLSAQEITTSWNGTFPVPGIDQNVYALAVEGESIAVLTGEGVRLYVDGVWNGVIPTPSEDRFFEQINVVGSWPTRNIALFDGEPWIVGESSLYRWTGATWTKVDRPTSERMSEAAWELAVVNNELFLAPDLHRWTGSGWESLLPECLTNVSEAVASSSGRWFLQGVDIGCGADQMVLFANGEVEPIGAPEQFEPAGGIAFDGETPVTRDSRYDGGNWSDMTYPGEIAEAIPNSRVIFPIVGGGRLYAAAPGWDIYAVASTSSGASSLEPCANQLLVLEGSTWRPVSESMDRPIYGVATSGTGVVIGGHFSSDHANVLADHIARFDGSNWQVPDDPVDIDYNGVEGRVNDVAMAGDSLWVGGRHLYSTGLVGSSTLLLLAGNRWNPVAGIEGVIDEMELVDGALWVAGNLTINGSTTTRLARLQNGIWEAVDGVDHPVVEMLQKEGTLYVGVVDGTDPRNPVSSLYTLDGLLVETLFSEWNGEMRTFLPEGEDVLIGGNNGALVRYTSGAFRTVASFGGRRPGLTAGDLPFFSEPTVDALLRHDGWLYVGGAFDSVAGVRAGSVARFNGTMWEALDSGVSRREGYLMESCNELVVDHVAELRTVKDEILVGGVFERIATPTSGHLQKGGQKVALPLALYNPAADSWRPATTTEESAHGEQPQIRAITIAEGRIAIAGTFTLAGDPDSRNLAITDRILSVGTIDDHPRNTLYSVRLTHDGSTLLLESSDRRHVTVELYDITGRLVAELHEGIVPVGAQEIALPKELSKRTHLIVVRDAEGGQATLRL